MARNALRMAGLYFPQSTRVLAAEYSSTLRKVLHANRQSALPICRKWPTKKKQVFPGLNVLTFYSIG